MLHKYTKFIGIIFFLQSLCYGDVGKDIMENLADLPKADQRGVPIVYGGMSVRIGDEVYPSDMLVASMMKLFQEKKVSETDFTRCFFDNRFFVRYVSSVVFYIHYESLVKDVEIPIYDTKKDPFRHEEAWKAANWRKEKVQKYGLKVVEMNMTEK